MAYDVDKTNGSALTTVLDGTVNDAKTDIKLFGRGVVNYGEIMAENLVHMIENFANDTAPLKPLLGQLYFNTTDSSLNVLVDDLPKTFAKVLTDADPIVTIASNAAKAWVKFNLAGAIQNQFGVISVDDLGTGNWRVNWDTPFANDDYVVQASLVNSGNLLIGAQFANQLTDSIEISTRDITNSINETGIEAIMVTAFSN